MPPQGPYINRSPMQPSDEFDDCGRPVDDSDPWAEREYERQELIKANWAQLMRARRAAAETPLATDEEKPS